MDLISFFFNKGVIVLETGKYYKADYMYWFVPVFQNNIKLERISEKELSKNMIWRFVYEFTF